MSCPSDGIGKYDNNNNFPSRRTTGKIKENKKRDKYLDLAREQRKQWNMRVTV